MRKRGCQKASGRNVKKAWFVQKPRMFRPETNARRQYQCLSGDFTDRRSSTRQSMYLKRMCRTIDSSSNDDWEDATTDSKAALAKKKELQETRELVKEERISGLEELPQQTTKEEQETRGPAKMDVADEHDSKIVAAQSEELTSENMLNTCGRFAGTTPRHPKRTHGGVFNLFLSLFASFLTFSLSLYLPFSFSSFFV